MVRRQSLFSLLNIRQVYSLGKLNWLSLNPQLLIGKIFICFHVRSLLTHRSFQYKILNNVFYLNKLLFKFGKIKSQLCSFCKSAEKTIIHLFSECLCAQYIWNQTQIFFSGYITIPNVTLHSTILGFTETSAGHFLLISHSLLIYKCYLYKARDSQNLRFFVFKKDIIRIKTLEERTSSEIKFLKKWQIINNGLSS